MSIHIVLTCEAGTLADIIPSHAGERTARDALMLWRRSPSQGVLHDLVRQEIASQMTPGTSSVDGDGPADPAFVIRYGIILLALAVLFGRDDTFELALYALRSRDAVLSIRMSELLLQIHSLIDGSEREQSYSWSTTDVASPRLH